MKRKLLPSNFIIFSLLLCLTCLQSFGQQTKKISLQGFLKDANGKAVENSDKYEITFKLYPVLSGGTAEWSETQELGILGGVYSTNLGTKPNTVSGGVTDFGNLSWGTKTYFVGVNIAGIELSPRTELTFAPYSLGSPFAEKANTANTANTVVCSGAVGDVKYSILNPTQFALQNGNCWVPMDGGSMAGSKLATIMGVSTVPNAGGLFLRGQEFSNSTNYDLDRNFNSPIAQVQAENFASHSHTNNFTVDPVSAHNHAFNLRFNTNGTQVKDMSGWIPSDYNPGGDTGKIKFAAEDRFNDTITEKTFNTGLNGGHGHTLSGSISNAGGNETRPDNLNLWTYIRIN